MKSMKLLTVFLGIVLLLSAIYGMNKKESSTEVIENNAKLNSTTSNFISTTHNDQSFNSKSDEPEYPRGKIDTH